MKLAIINGPNLNLQGTREPEIYGTTTFSQLLDELRTAHPDIEILYFQSNIEGELVDIIQQQGFVADALIVNLGAYSHYSIALRDAIAAVPVPCVEVHISHIFAREEYRHHSLITSACQGMICGLGLEGYALALDYLAKQKKNH